MRSTLEIILAVQESRPVGEEELRLALLALSSVDHFLRNSLNDLIEAVESDKASARLRATFARDTRERMFQALKKDPRDWLGPGGIPGTPEYERRYAPARLVARAAGVLGDDT